MLINTYTQKISFFVCLFFVLQNLIHLQKVTTSLHAISYFIFYVDCLIRTKGLLLLNIVYVCMTPTYCYKTLSIVHDTNMVPITYLSIYTTRYCFLPSLSHRFTLRPDPHGISYFILHGDCAIMNKETVDTKYCFILLDTNMVSITYY